MKRFYIFFLFILGIFALLSIAYADTFIIAPDGSLADWKGIKPFTLSDPKYIVYNRALWHGKNDLSAKLYITSSKKYLYIGIKVRDDSIVEAHKDDIGEILRSDHIEVWVDTNPERKNRDKMDKYVHQFIFKLTSGNGNCIELYPDNVEHINTIEYAYRRIKDGYVFEAKIPGFLLNAPEVRLSSLGILVDVVDIDKDERARQGVFLSLSPGRKWGKPNTFYKLNLSPPLYTFEIYNVASYRALFYSDVKFLDRNLVFYANYSDHSWIECIHILSSLKGKKLFSKKFPMVNIYPEIVHYNKNTTFITIRGETLLGYPVLEVFLISKESCQNIGLVVSKGLSVYPTFEDVDGDGKPEIVLNYRDGIRKYKYLNGRYRLTN